VNERFLDHQLEACQCAPDATTLERVVLPSVEDGLPAPGLRFGEPRTMALLACLCCFQHLFAGLTNRSLRELDPALPPDIAERTPLAKTWRAFERAVDDRIKEAAIAA
jgi:hypothetical protein